ncbi:MAG: hypothetical protein M1840_004670 [Geoglossum simile]|nr:MAG: hypothetical protein M1840_004670 [Geoglossum simile]
MAGDERRSVRPLAVEFPYPTDLTQGPISPPLLNADPAQRRPNLAKKSLTERPTPKESTSFLSLRSPRAIEIPDSTRQQLSNPNKGRGYIGPRRRVIAGVTNVDENTDPYSRFSIGNDHYKTRGKVSGRDGRLNISIRETQGKGYLAKALGGAITDHFDSLATHDHGSDGTKPSSSQISTGEGEDLRPRPKLNIVVMVIGSRGDIQPFLKIGKILKEKHGHRVRIATHPAFKEFVEKDSGLEFFSAGGDPTELMAFMVKNPGLVPSIGAVKAGDISRRRDQMFEMFQGFWRACTNATDDEKDMENLKMMGRMDPFVADAIIANPPSFAHIHCAERLGIPLHLMFTFPYSPTQQFPHPLANIKSNVNANYTNFMSYPLVEMVTWQGLGDLVNRFRVKTLGLEPMSTLWAPGQTHRLKVPYTYLWSPGLVPKPADWGTQIDIAGFVFLDLASAFKPPTSLVKFLESGDHPIYIGFGSIVPDDPDRFTQLIFEAIKKTGVRALVSKGWGELGSDDVPDNVYMLENTPHDWIFPRVSAVIHHGGAGTTAIGLKCSKPTMIVPFFGDQPFWGAMTAKAGAGYHKAVPYKHLTPDILAEGIKECLSPAARENAEKLAKRIAEEGEGAENAVGSFHRSLCLRGENSMRCSILEDRVSTWRLKRTKLRLSTAAAEFLVREEKIHWRDLRLIRHNEWNDFDGPGEPATGAGAAIAWSIANVTRGIVDVPANWVKRIRNYERHKKRGRRGGSLSNGGAKRDSFRTVEEDKTMKPVNELSAETAKAQKWGKEGSSPENESEFSDISEDDLAVDMVDDAKRGIRKSGKAFLKAPMDISLAVAQGFHNAPRLYGDTTVRRPIKITGMHSGLQAARNEFVFGVYDGWTGLAKHPYHGARDDGFTGFFKGLGKGVGGFVLKDIAAVTGPIGYSLKGIHKELRKDSRTMGFIRKARIIQGQKEVQALSDDEQKEIIDKVLRGWEIVEKCQAHTKSEKESGIRGRWRLSRERKLWHRLGVFENVLEVEKAMNAQKLNTSTGEAPINDSC